MEQTCYDCGTKGSPLGFSIPDPNHEYTSLRGEILKHRPSLCLACWEKRCIALGWEKMVNERRTKQQKSTA
ncbi:hypothetical protein LCGC14_0878300 [marine sediment metagenome]|uniref:Uncharacterized protein n=1 Tax=marine sediment metagenome TaxID=412755 RepID=A0A0F9P2L5_9ZZZZ